VSGVEELADRLAQLAEELGDLALDRLRSAGETAAQGSRPDPAFLAEERRLTRARRAVDKAVALLRQQETGADDGGAAAGLTT
jgi:hypothetical protein